MKRPFKFLSQSGFAKNVFVLMTGTGFAQAIAIAISPILTRIYTPEDFGVFALYMMIVSLLTVISTGRYEMAIMLPRRQKDVEKIVSLIVSLSLLLFLLTILIIFIFENEIASLLGSGEVSNWLYFVPISVFLNAIYLTMNYLLIRDKGFSVLAGNKVVFSFFNSFTQLGLGYLKFGGIGMLLSNVSSYLIATPLLFRRKYIREIFFNLRLKNMKRVAFKYKDFPVYDVPSSFVNLLTNQLPILAFSKYFAFAVAGYYSFTFRILSTPLNLLSNTVLDVFKQRATEDYHNFGNCKSIFLKTFRNLSLLGALPFLILFIWGPELFGFVFGEKWAIAGKYAQILTPMFMLKFITNPLSYVFYIFEKQQYNLLGQLVMLVLIFVAILIGVTTKDETLLLYFFSISYSIIYLAYLVMSYRLSLGKK